MTLSYSKIFRAFLGIIISTGSVFAENPRPSTLCNPLDLPYRFALKAPSRRAAADPTAIYFRGEYWLFASKSGGYWHSPDFLHWSFVEPKGLNMEAWAPTVEVINGRLHFANCRSGIYATDDPAQGNWTLVSTDLNTGHDGALFVDNDGRVYLYTGCSNKAPIRGVELDPKQDFEPIGDFVDLVSGDPLHRGWEARRNTSEPSDLAKDSTNRKIAPYIEGAWMNKVDGRYILQYAAPGTEHDTYGDGAFVSDHPLGPFTYQPYSPFSFKPTGFARGAGHGNTFKDAKGNYWHIATIAISRRERFERRLGLYPARFFSDGQLACNTYLGDYPQYAPGIAEDPFTSNSPGWMLLSLKKPVKASSELPGFPVHQAVDEDLHDWWSAATGDAGEWLEVDLGKVCRIEALQLNFADEGATQLGRMNDSYQYLVEVSDDNTVWKTLLDRRNNKQDSPHDYAQFDAPVMGRYVRVTNAHSPAGGKFSISGLRVFGNALASPPKIVEGLVADRNAADTRSAHLSWKSSEGAEFYIVRYGIKSDRLYSNYQVYDSTSVDITTLNADVPYYFTVDAVNGSGITPGPTAIQAKSRSR